MGKKKKSTATAGLKPIPNVWKNDVPEPSPLVNPGRSTPPVTTAMATLDGHLPVQPGMATSAEKSDAQTMPSLVNDSSANITPASTATISEYFSHPAGGVTVNGGQIAAVPMMSNMMYGVPYTPQYMIPPHQPVIPGYVDLMKRKERYTELESLLGQTELAYIQKWQNVTTKEQKAEKAGDASKVKLLEQERIGIENHYLPLLEKYKTEMAQLWNVFAGGILMTQFGLSNGQGLVFPAASSSDGSVQSSPSNVENSTEDKSLHKTSSQTLKIGPDTEQKLQKNQSWSTKMPTAAKDTPFLTSQISLEFPLVSEQSPLSKKDLKKLQERSRNSSGDSVTLPTSNKQNKPSRPSFTKRERYDSIGSDCSRTMSPDPHMKASRIAVSADTLENTAADCIHALKEKGDHISVSAVTELLCNRFQVNRCKDLGIRLWTDIKCVKKLVWKQSKVNAYIHAYKMTYSMGTLYELGQNLARLYDKEDFNELHLGPLKKQPELHVVFPVKDVNKEVCKITTTDILVCLNNCMKRSNRNAKMNLEDLLIYIKAKYGCDDLYDLGIRINSLGLGISVVSRARKDLLQLQDRVQKEYIQKMLEQFSDELQKIGAGITVKLDDTKRRPGLTLGKEVQKKYSEMDCVDVIVDLLTVTDKLFVDSYVKQQIQLFLVLLQESPLASKMFQLALCKGRLEPPSDLVPKEPKSVSRDLTPATRLVPENLPQRPREEQLFQELKERLDKLPGDVTFHSLRRFEHQLLHDFKFSNFSQLSGMTFLDFLHRHRKELEECCSGILTGSSGLSMVTKQELFHFLKQAGYHDNISDENLKTVAASACDQFGANDFQELGHGPLSVCLRQLQKSTVKDQPSIFFVTAFTGESLQRTSGYLGPQTKDKALSCLLKVPLLGNLEECTHWSLVFKPHLGALKPFLDKYGGPQNGNQERNEICDLYALQTSSGDLLRITKQTNTDLFSKAISDWNARNVAGHLTSLVVDGGGVGKLPRTLLTNLMTTGLKEKFSQLTERKDCNSELLLAEFVVKCTVMVPFEVCVGLAREIFIEPFVAAFGSMDKGLSLLWDACKVEEIKVKLEQLGLVLSIPQWTEHLMKTEHVLENGAEEELFEDELFSDEEIDNGDSDNGDSLKEEIRESLETDDCGFELKSSSDIPVADGSNADSKQSALVCAVPKNDQQTEQTATETADSIETSCLQVVQRIRQKFGYDLPKNQETNSLVVQEMKDMLGRSLERLSKELYTKVTHFVLELIQNADDNDYEGTTSEDGKHKVKKLDKPSLTFVVEKDKIRLYNNEKGFAEKHIEALCDVGKSTKGKHKQGYIGQKGIGFKSVFKVTNCPEVHSNGYHIKFDAASDPVGLVLPHWISPEDRNRDSEDFDDEVGNLSDKKWVTNIVLPLKDDTELDKDQSRSLTASFQDIQPTLLLFLHRLKNITVINQVTGSVAEMSRRDVSEKVIEIQTSSSKDRWLVVRKQLKVSGKFAQQYENVEYSELALAFPITNRGHLEKQQVFAYLPLRSFGFSFIIQGDFEIPSSRQDLDNDCAWNQWLRSEVPTLFVESLDVFKEHKDYRDKLKALQAFLKFVPSRGEIVDFFEPVAAKIHTLLGGRSCLPVEDSDGAICDWKKPSETVICPHDVMRAVISPDLLFSQLGLYYLHRKVLSASNESLLRSLGVKSLTSADVVDILVTVHDQKTKSSEGFTLTEVAEWFACLAHFLNEGYAENRDALLEKVRQLPLIFLNNGQSVSLSNTTVFFPFEDEKKKKVNKQQTAFKSLQEDINTVKSSLFNSLDDVKNSMIKRLLEILGVRHITSHDVIHQHIIPAFKDNSVWKTKSVDILVAYVTFIKQEWQTNIDAVEMNALKEVIQLRTSNGILNPCEADICFSPKYHIVKQPLDLGRDFPGVKWNLLHPSYINDVVLREDKEKWKKFFELLGVEDFIIVRRKKLKLTREDLKVSQWSTAEHFLPSWEDSFVIHDYSSDHVEQLFSTSLHVDQMTYLYRYISYRWMNQFKSYKSVKIWDKDEQKVLKDGMDSSFFTALKQKEWLPVTAVARQTSFSQVLVKASDCYLKNDRVYKLFADHVHYLSNEGALENNPFPVELGVCVKVTTEDIVSKVKDWASQTDNDGIRIFKTSLQHMKFVYDYIDRYLDEEKIGGEERMKLFCEDPGIFVPFKAARDVQGQIQEHVPVVGQFHSFDKLCWRDPTRLFVKYKPNIEDEHGQKFRRQMIQPYYESMKHLFRDTLGVMESPSFQEYAWLLVSITAEMKLPCTENIHDVYNLYQMLGSKCLMKKLQNEDLGHLPDFSKVPLRPEVVTEMKEILTSSPIFPTTDNKWVRMKDHPLLLDKEEIAEIFSPENENTNSCIYFINMEPLYVGRQDRMKENFWMDIFFRVTDVKKVSECLEQEYIPVGSRPSPSVQKYLHDAVPYIQKYLLKNNPEEYERLVSTGIKADLTLMTFFQVSQLEVVYRLKYGDREAVKTKQETGHLDKVDGKYNFYIQKDSLENYMEINKQIANLFFPNSDQSKFFTFLLALQMFLVDKRPRKKEEFCHLQKLKDIPLGMETWGVPKPLQLHIPSRQVSEVATTPKVTSADDLHWTEEDEKMMTSKAGESSGLKCWPPPPPIGMTGSRSEQEENQETTSALPELKDRPKAPTEEKPKHFLRHNNDGNNPNNIKEDLDKRQTGDQTNKIAPTQATTNSKQQAPAAEVSPNAPTDHQHPKPHTVSHQTPLPVLPNAPNPMQVVEQPTGPHGRPPQNALQPHQPHGSPPRNVPNSGSSAIITADSMSQACFTPMAHDLHIEKIPDVDLSSCNSTHVNVVLVENSGKSEVGRWGEMFVYSYLLEQYREEIKQNCILVKWLNKDKEMGLPYDLEVCTNGSVLKIEVKSTLSEKKELFEISSRELQEAHKSGAAYHIYRLYNAGQIYNQPVRLKIIEDIPRRLDAKAIKLFMNL